MRDPDIKTRLSEAVSEALQTHLQQGADLGAAFCMTRAGERVADAWGGHANLARTRPWRGDTLVCVFSLTKTLSAMVALLLADRGELDLHAPMARYWPAFAQAGKADVTAAQVLSHSAGLPDWAEPFGREDLYDWDKATTLLARQSPAWAPGTDLGYHSMTQGYLLGELVRRVTGRTLGQVFREAFAEPLAADAYIGLPASQDHRVADLEPPRESRELLIDVADAGTRDWRAAENPSVGAVASARGVAEVHAVLANGGEVRGRRYLSEAGCRRALEVQIEGTDRILGLRMRYGLGFAVAGGGVAFPNPNTLYWGGFGGSLAIIDLDARTSMAYVMNRMDGGAGAHMRGFGIAMAAWEALGLI